MPDLLFKVKLMGSSFHRITIGAEEQDRFSQVARSTGVPFMVLWQDKASAVRERLDASHELAHIIFHRSLENKKLNTKSENKVIENQAFYFAGALLMPGEKS